MLLNFLKKIFHIFIYCIRIILFLWIVLYLSLTIYDFFITKEFSFQIIIYSIFSFILLCYSVWIFLSKPKRFLIILYIVFWLSYIIMAKILPDVKTHYNQDICLDSGICSEGIKVKTEKAEFIITKENCIKYGYEWNEKRRDCNLRKK